MSLISDRQSNKANVERKTAANVQLQISSGSKSTGHVYVINLVFMQTVTTSATEARNQMTSFIISVFKIASAILTTLF